MEVSPSLPARCLRRALLIMLIIPFLCVWGERGGGRCARVCGEGEEGVHVCMWGGEGVHVCM